MKRGCAKKGHRFDGGPQVMESVPLGTGPLAHTTLMLVPCSRCLRAHQEFGGNSLGMTQEFREILRDMFSARGHEVFLAEEE